MPSLRDLLETSSPCRRGDRCEKQWPAHNNHVFACDWHPAERSLLATAGRDKTIKVGDSTILYYKVLI